MGKQLLLKFSQDLIHRLTEGDFPAGKLKRSARKPLKSNQYTATFAHLAGYNIMLILVEFLLIEINKLCATDCQGYLPETDDFYCLAAKITFHPGAFNTLRFSIYPQH